MIVQNLGVVVVVHCSYRDVCVCAEICQVFGLHVHLVQDASNGPLSSAKRVSVLFTFEEEGKVRGEGELQI